MANNLIFRSALSAFVSFPEGHKIWKIKKGNRAEFIRKAVNQDLELKAINKQLEKLEELIKYNYKLSEIGQKEQLKNTKSTPSPSMDDFISGGRKF